MNVLLRVGICLDAAYLSRAQKRPLSRRPDGGELLLQQHELYVLRFCAQLVLPLQLKLVLDVGMIQCCPRMFLELLVCWEGRWGGGELPATVSDGRRTGRLRGCLPFLRSGHVSARQHLYHRLQPSVVGTASIHTSRSSSVCPTRERERGREPGGLTREVERHLKMYHGAASEQASTLSVPIPL